MSEQDTTAEVVDETTEDTTPDESNESPEGTLEEADKEIAWDPERAKRKISKLNNEIRSVKERAKDADEKFATVAAKDKRITDLEKTALRYEVAFDLGLPKQIAERLQGSTKEEMLADAEKLVELIAPAKRPSQRPTEVLRGGLTPDAEPEETDLKKLGARMFSR